MRWRYETYVGGPLVSGRVPKWDWSRDGGDYKTHRDFFTVHWEVQVKKPSEVCLHVESPRATVDPVLNSIKAEIVDCMLAQDIKMAVLASGFGYRRGRRISPQCIAKFKSTEPFRVILPPAHVSSTIEKNLDMVHRIFEPLIERVLNPFIVRIAAEF